MFRNQAEKAQLVEAAIRQALGKPAWLQSVRLDEQRRVVMVIEADPNNLEDAERRRMDAEAAARAVKGVSEASAVLTAERAPGTASQTSSIPLTASPPPAKRPRRGARLSDRAVSEGAPTPASAPKIDGIPRILVVASAKGGVGKSTVSVNLAAAMAKTGMKVGLLDADIYGPSIPTMLGQQDAQPDVNADSKIVPVEAHGVKALSIGYFSDPDTAMIWRGPIVMSTIMQMLNDAAWATADDPLDLLIIDTPPGTGDAQLAIAQRIPVTAALIVTTPQEVALADVRRGAAMFAKTAVPVIGVAETMSWFEDPSGARHYLMGEGGGKRIAETLGLPLLAQLPMLPAIREGGDTGTPAALSDEAAGALFTDLARSVAIALDNLDTEAAPEIVFEDD